MAPDDDDSTDALVDGLVRSAFQVMGVLTRLGAEHDLSLTQLRVLGILRDRTLRMSDLAAFLGLDKSTMSGLIARAERRGLLTRGTSPGDKRAVVVLITDEGRALIQRLYEEGKPSSRLPPADSLRSSANSSLSCSSPSSPRPSPAAPRPERPVRGMP